MDKLICIKCECEIDENEPVFWDENDESVCEDCKIQSMAMKLNLKGE